MVRQVPSLLADKHSFIQHDCQPAAWQGWSTWTEGRSQASCHRSVQPEHVDLNHQLNYYHALVKKRFKWWKKVFFQHWYTSGRVSCFHTKSPSRRVPHMYVGIRVLGDESEMPSILIVDTCCGMYRMLSSAELKCWFCVMLFLNHKIYNYYIYIYLDNASNRIGIHQGPWQYKLKTHISNSNQLELFLREMQTPVNTRPKYNQARLVTNYFYFVTLLE